MEDALTRLDKLTQEEARTAIAENLRATHAVDERVGGVTERVLAVDDRVTGVDDRLAGVDERVAGVDDKVDQVIRSSSLDLIIATYSALHIISEIELRENIHRWLSPPNPSANHNIACGTHHKKTATWFFEGKIYHEWKSKGSLLWVHGKRAPCPNFPSDYSDDIVVCSWLGKEHSLVSAFLAPSITSRRRLPLVP